MPTFRLTAKTQIGCGAQKVTEGATIQICKGCTVEPSSQEIALAIKQQLGIDLIAQKSVPHLGQFNWVMLK